MRQDKVDVAKVVAGLKALRRAHKAAKAAAQIKVLEAEGYAESVTAARLQAQDSRRGQ